MKTKIMFVRMYTFYNTEVCEVIRKATNGHTRVNSYYDEMPKTIKAYIETATKITHQVDRFHGREVIYEGGLEND